MTIYGNDISKQLPLLATDLSQEYVLMISVGKTLDHKMAFLSPKEVKALTVELLSWYERTHYILKEIVQEETEGGLPF